MRVGIFDSGDGTGKESQAGADGVPRWYRYVSRPCDGMSREEGKKEISGPSELKAGQPRNWRLEYP